MREKATNVPVVPEARHFLESWTQSANFIAVFVLVALVSATPNCPASTVGLEALYTTTISSTVTITGVPEAQKSITSANYMTVLVTIQLGDDVSLSRWQLEVVIHRDLMRISKNIITAALVRWRTERHTCCVIAIAPALAYSNFVQALKASKDFMQ